MYARALFDIIHSRGDTALRLIEALEGGADELFTSHATLAAVEDQLLDVARTLAHLPPVVMLRLSQVDWQGWSAVLAALRARTEPRRDIVWYGLSALLPATLVLLDRLRADEPEWFEIPY